MEGLPEIVEGDELGSLIVERLELEDGDVVVVSQKVVSKSEGRIVRLDDIEPSAAAVELAAGHDPRHLEVILREAARIVRARPPLVIAETRHGFVCASAGVDASNAPEPGTLVLLPVDPDASAAAVRQQIGERTGRDVGVIVSDSFGRPFRTGIVDVAIGVAGITPLVDWRGQIDPVGHELTHHRHRRRRRDRIGCGARHGQALGRAGGRRPRARGTRPGVGPRARDAARAEPLSVVPRFSLKRFLGAADGETVALHDVSRDPAWPQENALVDSYRRLAEVFHHVLSEQSLDTLLDRIADTLDDLVPYDALQIYEADNTRNELIPVLARSEWENEIMRTRPAFGQGITGWAVVNREPVLANQAHLDPRVAFIPGTPAEPEALVSIPLVARGSLKGALNMYRLGETASFDKDEFELAKWFGDAAALALDNAQVRARLEHQAQTDSLTGLYNHRHFHERLRAELMRASRARDSVALLMFDIDEFKRVNDICGHAVGDQILVGLAELTSSLVRSSDVVCRIGGEEFAVIMPSCDAGDALGRARRLTERLEARPVDAAGEITISVGIAHGPENAGNPRELVDCAESAMMTAKARGKNRIVVYAGGLGERPDVHESSRDVRSVAHLKMLQSVVARLNRMNSVREISEAIVSELRGLIDYHSCRVYFVEGDYVVPVAIKGDGVTEEQQVQATRIELGTGITGSVALTGRSVLVANALECDFAIQIPGTEKVDESVIAVPLRYGTRVTGVVFLSKLGVGQFDENDLRLLEVLAGYAAVSLENARLYESLRREADHAKAWLEFADAVSDASSAEQIAEEAVKATASFLECEVVSLWLEDPQVGDFQCLACSGCREAPLEGAMCTTRLPRLSAETLMEVSSSPRRIDSEELAEVFRKPELAASARSPWRRCRRDTVSVAGS